MKLHVLLIGQMTPAVEAQLGAVYYGHRLFAAHDRLALVAGIGSSVHHGFTAALTSEPQAPPRKSFVHC